MYIRRNIRLGLVAKFAWFNLFIFTLWSGGVVYIYHLFLHWDINIGIPFLPLSTIGIAVAFYIGFKNNASYDRFWEGRKIWGGIVNYSRTWSNQVLSFVNNRHAHVKLSDEELKDIHTNLIYHHIAWFNALRLHLRQPSSFSRKHKKAIRKMLTEGTDERQRWDDEVGGYFDREEYCYLIELKNTPAQIIRHQGKALKDLEEKGLIEDFRHMEMMRVLEEFYNLQGKCERIKNTPFPRQYAFFSKIFTWIFILLLPFGMVREFDAMGGDAVHSFIWLTVPFCVLISWIFITMENVGDSSEDPFEGYINDVPMTALSRTIEIDLREMLGETDLPEKIKPVHDVLL